MLSDDSVIIRNKEPEEVWYKNKLVLLLFLILFPPLPVYILYGCNIEFCIAVFLWLLIIPGFFYSLYMIFSYEDKKVPLSTAHDSSITEDSSVSEFKV